MIILAALNPSTFKDFVLKVGKGGTELSLRREAPQEESEILKEVTQENPPEEIKIEAEKLIEAAEKRKEGERAPEDYLALAFKAWEDKNFEESLGLAYSGLNLNPKNKETQEGFFNTLGILHREIKSYKLAEKNFKKALEIDEEAYWVHNNLGVLYSHQKDFDRAKDYINLALKINPQYAKGYNNLGLVF